MIVTAGGVEPFGPPRIRQPGHHGPAASHGRDQPGVATGRRRGNPVRQHPALPAVDVPTAFRWLFPSVTANGEWSEPLATLVALHRSSSAAMAPTVPKINKATWDNVVGNVHVTAAGVVTRVAGDPLAVYRAPWQTSAAPNAVATELDLMQHVRYRRCSRGWPRCSPNPAQSTC